jgi:hypothetical protein
MATAKDTTLHYHLPDSVKAVQFMAEFSINNAFNDKYFEAGIKTNVVSIGIRHNKNTSSVIFSPSYHSSLKQIAIGANVYHDKKYVNPYFNYTLTPNEKYKLLISQATDSVTNTSIYSGYIFLPKEKAWKLIASYQYNDRWHTISAPSAYITKHKKSNVNISVTASLVQRNSGSWKNLLQDEIYTPSPNLKLSNHLDSLVQATTDLQIISNAIAAGKVSLSQQEQGIFFEVMQVGTGAQIQPTDTVTVHYKGYLFNDGFVFDQTQESPITFPLNQLIKGWQIALPACKVGSKVKIVIPSGLAYSIRTISTRIIPNSILVFEVAVLNTQPIVK